MRADEARCSGNDDTFFHELGSLVIW
jgi:hypothetical protein